MEHEDEGEVIPLLVVSDHWDALRLFVEKANMVNQEDGILKPDWLNLTDGRISPGSLMNDIGRALRIAGGDDPRENSSIVVPDTIIQYSRVLFELANIQSHPYMQNVMKEVLRVNPEFRSLAKLTIIITYPKERFEPLGPLRESLPLVNLFD